jgi:hypothetical protein
MGMQIKRQFNDEASAFDLALIPPMCSKILASNFLKKQRHSPGHLVTDFSLQGFALQKHFAKTEMLYNSLSLSLSLSLCVFNHDTGSCFLLVVGYYFLNEIFP